MVMGEQLRKVQGATREWVPPQIADHAQPLSCHAAEAECEQIIHGHGNDRGHD